VDLSLCRSAVGKHILISEGSAQAIASRAAVAGPALVQRVRRPVTYRYPAGGARLFMLAHCERYETLEGGLWPWPFI